MRMWRRRATVLSAATTATELQTPAGTAAPRPTCKRAVATEQAADIRRSGRGLDLPPPHDLRAQEPAAAATHLHRASGAVAQA